MTSTLIQAQRQAAFQAVAKTIKQSEHASAGPHDLRYPVGIPELNRHLDDLIALARIDPDRHRDRIADGMQNRICEICPHQFPSNYCPRRHKGGCTAFRLAEQIVNEIGLAISAAAQHKD